MPNALRMQQPTTPPLLVTSREAARLLAISERTLWTLAHDGSIRQIKIKSAVRYALADLKALTNDRAKVLGGP